jgi:hypothetical protein
MEMSLWLEGSCAPRKTHLTPFDIFDETFGWN